MKKQTISLPKVSPGLIFSDESEAEIDMDDIKDIRDDKKVSNQEQFSVVDVCTNKKLFETFERELREQKSISMSLACDKFKVKPVQSGGIGQRITRRTAKKTESEKVRLS